MNMMPLKLLKRVLSCWKKYLTDDFCIKKISLHDAVFFFAGAAFITDSIKQLGHSSTCVHWVQPSTQLPHCLLQLSFCETKSQVAQSSKLSANHDSALLSICKAIVDIVFIFISPELP